MTGVRRGEGITEEDEPGEEAPKAQRAVLAKVAFSVFHRSDCFRTECVPLDLRGAVAELWGRALALCAGCGAPCERASAAPPAAAWLCHACRFPARPDACFFCGAERRADADPWVRRLGSGF